LRFFPAQGWEATSLVCTEKSASQLAENYRPKAHTYQIEKQGEQPPEESMRNITVTIPDDVYRRARIWAAERDTSVSAVVKYLLETLPGIKRSNLAFPARNSNSANTSVASLSQPIR
jgi:hypothetical protein